MKLAQMGVSDLQKHVDTYIVINNQSLFRIADEKTTFAQALQEVDKILYLHIREVSSLMVGPGYINLDFAAYFYFKSIFYDSVMHNKKTFKALWVCIF